MPKKMSVERWANCHKKEFAHRSKRSLNLKERAFLAIRSVSDDTMLSFWWAVGSKKFLPNDMSTLHKPVMQPELPLDGSVLQQAMLPLYISVLKQPVLPGRVFSIEPMLPCLWMYLNHLKQPVLSLNGSIVQQPELPLHVSVLLFYSIVCCLWTCLA
jgi:hypothetical protein